MNTMQDLDSTILLSITPTFRSVFELDDLILSRDLDASRVEAWDSLNHISLIVELENLAGIIFTTDDLASMINVGSLVDILIAKGYKG
jgi:acyl carrier protein